MIRPARILVIADEATTRTSVAAVLRAEGHVVEMAADSSAALSKRDTFSPHVVVLDFEMKSPGGMDLVTELRASEEPPAIIVAASQEQPRAAVNAMRSGAADYIFHPLELEELTLLVGRALERLALERENRQLRARLRDRVAPTNIIGAVAPMQRAFTAIDRAAPGKTNVILRGEPGTGKQLLASALHMRSPRSTTPFIKLHGSMATETQLTDLPSGSTVFVDDVSELSATAQAALLALVLRPVADVRVVAATAKDLTQEVQAGRFLKELYECLAGVTVELPLLRDRKSDIPALVKFFMERAAKEHRKRLDRVAPAALAAMLSYDWPGNVRELEHAIEHASAIAPGPSLEAHHLPPTVRPPADSNCPPIPGSRLDELERYAILETLKLTNGSTSKAAEMLGISVRTIQYRLHEYNATPNAQLESLASNGSNGNGKKLAI